MRSEKSPASHPLTSLFILSTIILACMRLEANGKDVENPALINGAHSSADHKVLFANVVRDHFDRWDADHNQQLTPEEVDKLIHNPGVKANAAAALAAIKFGQERPKQKEDRNKPFSLQQLAEYEQRKRNNQIRDIAWDYQRHFDFGRLMIDQAVRKLFAREVPHLNVIEQHLFGDCYIVSTIGAVVARNPKHLTEIMSEVDNGRYKVCFKNRPPLLHMPLTDAELAMGASSGQDGVWLQVLEKAIAKELEKMREERGKQHQDIADAMNLGDSVEGPVKLLTGQNMTILDFSPTQKNHEKARNKTETALPRVCQEHRLVFASTPDKVPPGMGSRHWYAVLGFDEPRKIVHVWNPWGNAFTPKGPAGPQNGYHVEHGRFEVPMAEFMAVFNCIAFERQEPTK